MRTKKIIPGTVLPAGTPIGPDGVIVPVTKVTNEERLEARCLVLELNGLNQQFEAIKQVHDKKNQDLATLVASLKAKYSVGDDFNLDLNDGVFKPK